MATILSSLSALMDARRTHTNVHGGGSYPERKGLAAGHQFLITAASFQGVVNKRTLRSTTDRLG